MRIAFFVLLLVVGCGVGRPMLALKRPAVQEALKKGKHPLNLTVAVAPATLPEKRETTHKYASTPKIPPERLQALFVDASNKASLFKKALPVKNNPKSPFEAAKKAGVDLVLVPKFHRAEVYYAGTTSWYVPNLIIWFFLDVASWFVADEKYGLALEGKLEIYATQTRAHLLSLPIRAKVEAPLDDFQRGWRFWGILFIPKKLSNSNWIKVTNTLLPHLEEEVKSQFIQGIMTSFLSLTKKEEFAKLLKRPAETRPKPTPKPVPAKAKPPRVATKSLPTAQENRKYSFKLAATGGKPPYSFKVSDLPKGLSCTKEGLISGTPQKGTGGRRYNLKVEVFDSKGGKGTGTLVLAVRKAPKPKKPTLVAVVVGVENYKGANLGRAAFALRDAREVAKTIRSLKSYDKPAVILIENEKATEKTLKKAIEAVKQCDLFILFFAGNGGTGLDKEGAHYLLLHDSTIPDFKNALKLTDLIEMCRKAKAKQRLLLIDAGFNMSGEGRTPIITEIKPKSSPFPKVKAKDIVVILACSGEQTAFSSALSKVRHGFFSHYLLKALAGKADSNRDGKLTEEELFRYLRSCVKEESSETQTPVKLGEGKAVLLLK